MIVVMGPSWVGRAIARYMLRKHRVLPCWQVVQYQSSKGVIRIEVVVE